MSNYDIRNMTIDEVKNIAVEWAAVEGWNPGLYDYLAFYNCDPNGFFVGLLDNIPIACISAISYEGKFGFIGFYIVKPEFRGMGYGLKVWNKGIEYLSNHNIGLDGVVAQQSNYAKSGFKLAYSNIRYEGRANAMSIKNNNIFPFINEHFNTLVEYDNNFFPVPRRNFLKHWFNLPDSATFLSLENNKITGCATIRKCRVGYKVGPLFAETYEIAESLFAVCNNFAEAGSPIYLDTPEVNFSAVSLAEENDMKQVFGTARMYTKEIPNINVDRIYGVTTFELG